MIPASHIKAYEIVYRFAEADLACGHGPEEVRAHFRLALEWVRSLVPIGPHEEETASAVSLRAVEDALAGLPPDPLRR